MSRYNDLLHKPGPYMRQIIKAHPEGGIDYLHSYHSSRPRVDWNRCGQAAVATLLDYHGLNPYGLNKPIYDENDGHRHWANGEIIDRSCGCPPSRVKSNIFIEILPRTPLNRGAGGPPIHPTGF